MRGIVGLVLVNHLVFAVIVDIVCLFIVHVTIFHLCWFRGRTIWRLLFLGFHLLVVITVDLSFGLRVVLRV